MHIHGYDSTIQAGEDPCSPYGADLPDLEKLENESAEFKGFLSEKLEIKKSQVIRAVREEMARTLEDVLARRTRSLLLDARESIRIAPEAARLMAEELGQNEAWIKEQLNRYTELAERYLPGSEE